jgi:hypothetical protein
MNIDHLYSEVPPEVSKATIERIARAVAKDILECVRWYDIDCDDIWREDSIEYIQSRIMQDYDLE